MSETLTALSAAILDTPTDRTVRLVYADALDESGVPSNAARAEFIRGQIALEATPDGDPQRETLATRCEGLFAANWIDWWRPVCAAVGLPEPYVPKRRLRDVVLRERSLRAARAASACPTSSSRISAVLCSRVTKPTL